MKKRLMESRNAICSSVKVKSMLFPPSALRQAEQTFGDDVALYFIGAGIDWSGLCKQESFQPFAAVGGTVAAQFSAGSQNPHCRFVHVQIQFRPENLVAAGFGADHCTL